MALPNVAKVVRIDVHATLFSDVNVQNRYFFQYAGALSSADAQTWLNSFQSDWAAQMAAQISSQYSITLFTLTDLTSPTASIASNATATPGTNAGGSFPSAVCAIIKRRIGRRYRGGHSRLYLAGIPNNTLTNSNTFTAAYQTALIAAYNAFISAFLNHVPAGAAPATEVNVSYFAGFTNHTYPSGRIRPVPTQRITPAVDLIISHSMNPKVGSQRRRNLQSV